LDGDDAAEAGKKGGKKSGESRNEANRSTARAAKALTYEWPTMPGVRGRRKPVAEPNLFPGSALAAPGAHR
jgi:hypothetical protein